MQARGSLVLLSFANAMLFSSGFLLSAGLTVASSRLSAASDTPPQGISATSLDMPADAGETARRVLVTGASGRTGGIVFEKLLQKEGYVTTGMVRSAKGAAKLKKKTSVDVLEENIAMADVTNPDSLTAAMEGMDEVVLCTSAVPKIRLFSLVKLAFKKLLRFKNPGRPKFRFCKNGTPEEVDWMGAKALIDAAKAAGVQHFVYVGSMGGTQPDNFLNTFGRKKDGTGGDILFWKRKAEEYLIASGLTYTIIHPGGLLDSEGGKRRIVLGINDELMSRKSKGIPRADVAQICVDCLGLDASKNRSFDVASDPEGEGEVTADCATLVQSLKGDTDYSMAPQPSNMS